MSERFERAPQPISQEPSEPLPPHTAEHGDAVYDVQKLIDAAETIPSEIVPIAIFDSLKEQQYWHGADGVWLGPSNLISLAEKHNGDWNAMALDALNWIDNLKKIRDADYENYPILVVGQDDVIDGMHRLTKAWIDGTKEITIKRFQSLPPDAEIPRNLA